jgi:uncharacterized Zn-binding protein involved in type VI secretion
MDAVGNQSTTNYTVVNNSAALTINNFSSQLGGSPRNVIPSVSGSIQLTNCTLWVNGIQAAQNGDGAWQASSVPLGSGGTAVVEARAIPNTPSDNNGNGAGMTGATSDTPGNPTAPDSVAAELEMDQPAVVYMQSFSYNHTYKYNENVCTAETSTQGFETGVSASYGNGGTAYANSAGTTTIGTNVNTWSETQNFNWPCDQCAVTDIETNQNETPIRFKLPFLACLQHACRTAFSLQAWLRRSGISMEKWDLRPLPMDVPLPKPTPVMNQSALQ